MRYEVYRNKSVSPEDLKKDLEFYGQVESEDKWLAGGAQGNLNCDMYTDGPLHPEVEEGVYFVTQLVKKMLHDHVDREKLRGSEWWPARRTSEKKGVGEDEAFCRGVCESARPNDAGGDDILAW